MVEIAFEQWVAQFIALANGTKLSILMVMIVANFLIGVAISLYTGEFRLTAIADFMKNRIVPYCLGYFTVCLMALVMPAWKVMVPVVWGILLAALLFHILASLKEMGIKIPEILAGKKK